MHSRGSTLIYVLITIFILVAIGGIYYFMKNSSQQSSTSPRQINPVNNNNSANPNAQNTTELPLTITSPADKTQTTDSSITVQGTTVPNITVHVNEDTGQSDTNGNFSIQTSLDPGDNSLNIYVYDNKGNYAQKEITVTNQNY